MAPIRSPLVLALLWVFLAALWGCAAAQAQPRAASQPMAVGPGRVYVVAGQDPAASDSGPGTAAHPFKTISRAAKLAQPGDTVLVEPGVYREWVRPARGGTPGHPIVYQAAPGGRVLVKGSELWKPAWTPLDGAGGVYHASFDPGLFRPIPGVPGPAYANGNNPYRVGLSVAPQDQDLVARPVSALSEAYRHWQKAHDTNRLPLTLGQIFVDGRMMLQRQSLAEVQAIPGTWITDDAGDGVIVHFPDAQPPQDHRVELTVRPRIFAPIRRGLGYIQVRGFIFEHCANQGPFPQGGEVSVRSGRNWVIQDNTIRYAATIGLDVGSETWAVKTLRQTLPQDQHLIISTGHLIRHNTVCDNGLCGITGWNARGLKILDNTITRNNTGGYTVGSTWGVVWYEQGGIKLHGGDVLIEGNRVYDNDAFGIWIDGGHTGARIARNLVYGNTYAGVFMELGNGRGWIENNVIARNCGDGVYAHDSSAITVANNLIFQNGHFGIWMHIVSDRKYRDKLVECSHQRIVNNLIVGNYAGAISLPLRTARSHDNDSDHNVLMDGGPMAALGAPVLFLNRNNGRIDLGAHQGQPASPSTAVDPRQQAMSGRDLSLKEWSELTGWDRHSVAAGISHPVFRPLDRMMGFDVDLSKLHKAPRAADTLEFDFSGQPVAGDPLVWPGPWQELKSGSNQFSLWPIADVNRAQPTTLPAR